MRFMIKEKGGVNAIEFLKRLTAIMHHASRFCPPGWPTHSVDPSVWIGVRQLAMQRIGD